jgi:5'-phosphate synthase pdxT subunit
MAKPGSWRVKIGVLAVQGDFEAHGRTLDRLQAQTVWVRRAADLAGVNGVILPGGESTTMLKFLEEEGLESALNEFAARGGAIFGTCAGTILLAREVRNPAQRSLSLLDAEVSRNAYGRQIASEVRHELTSLKDEPMEMVFIRAPIIESVGPSVEVLASLGGKPVLVRQENILAATFHPELTTDTTVHGLFLRMATAGSGEAREISAARHKRVVRAATGGRKLRA